MSPSCLTLWLFCSPFNQGVFFRRANVSAKNEKKIRRKLNQLNRELNRRWFREVQLARKKQLTRTLIACLMIFMALAAFARFRV